MHIRLSQVKIHVLIDSLCHFLPYLKYILPHVFQPIRMLSFVSMKNWLRFARLPRSTDVNETDYI